MSKTCLICNYLCEDNTTFCPACGTPLAPAQDSKVSQSPNEIQPQTTTNPQQSISVQPEVPIQTIVQPQPAVQVPPRITTPIQPPPQQSVPQQPFVQTQQATSQQPFVPTQQNVSQQPLGQVQQDMPQQPFTPTQQSMPQQPFAQTRQGMPQQPFMQIQQDPPKKKSRKALWIILGIIGGIIILLLLLLVILFFVFAGSYRTNQTLGNNSTFSGFDSNGNYHEYYYPEYDHASFNSEDFVDTTTETPTTEAANTPAVSANEVAAFRAEDLTLLTIVADASTAPISVSLAENTSYTIANSGQLADLAILPPELEGKQFQLGRNVGTGATIDDVIAAYGIDTTNAIWQENTDGTYAYFYYSTTVRPENGATAGLIIGWYRIGDTWSRMTPTELYDLWSTGTPPACDALLLHQFYTDENYNVASITVGYGNASYFTITPN